MSESEVGQRGEQEVESHKVKSFCPYSAEKPAENPDSEIVEKASPPSNDSHNQVHNIIHSQRG